MTESSISSALEIATGRDANVLSSDHTGRYGTHTATFVIQAPPEDRGSIIQTIMALEWYENITELKTELNTAQDVPIAFILITIDCTF